VLVGVAMTQSAAFGAWLCWPDVALGLALVVGAAEFEGPFEDARWGLDETLVPIAYVLWSIWLVTACATLLIG
jgi:hypothetical protein